MPQMAPMLWLYLFIYFIATYIMFMILNFFSKPPIMAQLKKTHKPHMNLNWKW
uniref:ATP synthase complex subunit 8 n=1 Tax=Spongicola levigatus TaxID=1873861 RepID=A0A3Q8AMC3_9EUCA|nr:ATP synthase F0 subunit 8 [Spongicola levigatus]